MSENCKFVVKAWDWTWDLHLTFSKAAKWNHKHTGEMKEAQELSFAFPGSVQVGGKKPRDAEACETGMCSNNSLPCVWEKLGRKEAAWNLCHRHQRRSKKNFNDSASY